MRRSYACKESIAHLISDDQRLELPLLRCALQDLTLDRVLAHEPEDEHRLCLPDLMRTILCLQTHLRALISVIN